MKVTVLTRSVLKAAMKRRTLLRGSLIGLGLLLAATVSPASALDPFDAPGFAQAIAAQERHTDFLLDSEGVVGTAVGETEDGAPAVQIFTMRAGVAGLPRTLDGVPVVIRVTGQFFALHHKNWHQQGGGGEEAVPPPEVNCSDTTDPTARSERPVCIGVSTGNEGECSSGTIGARVKAGSNVYALSNNHVYANENAAPIGSDILQPGRYDTNCAIDPNDVIGTLDDFVPIDFNGGDNTVDAAIALTTTDELGNATPSNGYGTPKSTTVAPAVGMNVQKYGRTTSLTKGTITGINATVNVGYSSGTARFVHQIIVQSRKPFLKPGDSGSLLVGRGGGTDRKPVGLMYAANISGTFAVANEIGLVLTEFGVSIDGD